MKKKIVSVMLTAAMAATLLAGCGSSSAATDTAAEETTEAADETAEDSQKQLMRLQKMQKRLRTPRQLQRQRCSRSYDCRAGCSDYGNQRNISAL